MVQLIFEPRDLWVGLYITKKKWCTKRHRWLNKIYIMLLPMFGLKIEWSSL